STCARNGGCTGPTASEEPRARAARNTRLVAGRPCIAACGFAPDHQRDRDRALRPEPAARIPHRSPVRHVDRIHLRTPGGTGVNKRIGIRVVVAVLAIAAIVAWKQRGPDDNAPAAAAAQPRAAGFDYGTLHFTPCELPQPH